jgi:hypothetical protein
VGRRRAAAAERAVVVLSAGGTTKDGCWMIIIKDPQYQKLQTKKRIFYKKNLTVSY